MVRREENWLEAHVVAAAEETVEGESQLPKLSADLWSPQGMQASHTYMHKEIKK